MNVSETSKSDHLNTSESEAKTTTLQAVYKILLKAYVRASSNASNQE
jgi:hypothetical protein